MWVAVPPRGTILRVEKRELPGEASQEGRVLAAVVVTEQAELVGDEVLTPGSNRISHRQRVERGPTSIVFETIYDEKFDAKLERLASVPGDLQAKRALRDSGESHLTFTLTLDDGRQLEGAHVTWPEFGHGDVRQMQFPLLHEQL